MLDCRYACRSASHGVSRRQFLGTAAAGALGTFGLGALAGPAAASSLAKAGKRVLLVYLAGGVSQLETWDPKPGTDTGGPFRPIATSVTGVQISELLPHTARQMHRLALVRSLNTFEAARDDHGKGDVVMHTGRAQEPGIQYPHLGSVVAKLLGADQQALPGYVHVLPKGGSGFNKADAAFLGARFASVTLADGQPPANLLRPEGVSADDDRRNELRARLSERFSRSRRTAQTEAYTQSFEQADQVVRRSDLFDLGREDPRAADRYGRHDLGRHFLLARRMLEAGVTFVKVTHTNYDTHHENFDFHIEQLGEFDRPFATLLDDLADRGLLESTLVVVMSEMGRTPRINNNYGRDHWTKAWSVCLGGCGIAGGAVVGKTNANGTAVADREVNAGHLFHTYLKALGLDPTKNFYPDERPVPIADPKSAAITEVLA
jgi:hypothetical protein